MSDSKLKMGKILPLIVMIVCVNIIVSCKKESTVKQLNFVSPETFGLLKNADSVSLVQDSTSMTYSYRNFSIKVVPHPSFNGDLVTVSNDSKSFDIGTKYSCFFKGVYSDHIIIDTGTGQSRGLELYDTHGELVFNTEYLNDLELDGDNLIYWSSVETEAVLEKPDCFNENQNSDFSIGLIQKQSYSLKSHKVKKTNIIDCQFYE